MPLPKRHREALTSLGVEAEEYYIEGWPPVWGTALIKNGKEIATIETHGSHHDDSRLRNKYILKKGRGVLHKPTSVHNHKREALAAFVRLNWRV